MGLPDIETIPETGAVFTIGRSRFADNVASHFFIRKDPVVAIECGDEHSAVICQTGRLFVFGSNDWGQLGLGHKNHISKPSCVKILKPEKVTHVACGRAHTLICTGAQKVFACGSNQEGQLGRENSAIGDSSSSPILIYDCGLGGPRIVQIAAGSHHSMVLTSDGGVVAWGSNLEGQLGLPGVSGLVNKPTKVPIPEPVKEISAGYYHSAFLTESGLVYVCGESESGKLGIDVNFSTQVAPKQIQLPTPALHIACGGHHTLVLAENGNIYCFGSNSSGQLGMGTNVNEIHLPKHLARGSLRNEKIVKITCGESHSAILTELGKLFTCGDGRHGKLGLEENENNVHEVTFAAKYQELFITDVACGGCHTILVGRRHEMDHQSDSTESAMQNKSSLPPLKLPVNMQNEHRVDSTEKSIPEKDNSHHVEKSNETPKHNDIETNSKDSSKENSDIVSNEKNSSSANDEKIASPKKCPSETSPSENSKEKVEKSQPTDEEDESKNKESAHDENAEDKLDNESKDVQENNESQKNNENVESTAATDAEDAQDAEESRTEAAASRIQEKTEQETSTNPTPPPKPPRLKSGSIENTSKENDSLQENEKDEDEKNKDEKETKTSDEPEDASPKSLGKLESVENMTEKIVEAVENSIEKVKENIHGEESEKVEADGAQDDADVVQSPAPRTAKMAKLFKGKRQEVENGTKMSSAANPKAKSKTCTVL
ncbi:X-linked retinitis pigmentosa GTPase regulator-like [Nylanderia fulva]|uniref:X-linked retinitis pigmentosa GTPase regulator-like n=1 Tax=Nylanderia fulva TaxID=613905 RepID=UPI0010FB93D4|nr:X-linked retinitis pigmentosa GTPase regulator-like [Nylanderia fulva]